MVGIMAKRKKFTFEVLKRVRRVLNKKGEKVRKPYYWSRIKGANYRVMYVSETYTTKGRCIQTVDVVMNALGRANCAFKDLTVNG